MKYETVNDVHQAMNKALEGIPQEALDQELGLTVRIVRLLASGKPVSVEQLAESWEMPLEQVKMILEQAREGSLELNDNGEVVGASGLSQKPSPHHLHIEGQTLYAWCAFDSVFLPAFLGKTVKVDSKDPINGEAIHLTISPDGILDCSPATVVLSLYVPWVDGTSKRVGADSDACTQMNYFASDESAKEWAKSYPDVVILTVEEAYELARRQWLDSLKRVLA